MTSVFADSRWGGNAAFAEAAAHWHLPSRQQAVAEVRQAAAGLRQRVSFDRARSLLGWRSSQALVGRRYAERGLRIVSQPDPEPDLTTLQAREGDKVVGTLSVRFDSPNGLASDAVFPEEIQGLRNDGWRLCECTRLAVDGDNPSKPVLASLFHLTHLFIYRVRNANMVVMEVHPRHAPFYRRMLGAKVLASGRDNPTVQAPSVLMCIELAGFEAQWQQLGGRPDLVDSVRSLFPYGYGPNEVPALIERLRAEL